MIKGLYSAATSLVALERSHEVIANNIANASAPGFRSQKAVQKGFYDVFVDHKIRAQRFNQALSPGGGVSVVETFTDTRSGPVVNTGNPLNIGLSGPGFLVVDTPQGERYSRSGALMIDAEGQLTTANGDKIMGMGGPISARGSSLSISEDGMVTSDGVSTGQLRLIEFDDPHMLTREGEGLYSASAAALVRSAPATGTRVSQESLEMSNVNVPQEMVNMILGLRAYGASQNVINAMDETMSRLIEQVGTPS